MRTRRWEARPLSVEANAISSPPGEYGRKVKTQRNCRGPAQAVEHVVLFYATRRTLPALDIQRTLQRCGGAFGSAETGAAWLSSARVVRCWVKSRNERNPCP